MTVPSKRTWRWLAVGTGVVFGSIMYLWTADTRSLLSYAWAVTCGIGVVYLLSTIFVPGNVNRSDGSTEENSRVRTSRKSELKATTEPSPADRIRRIAWGAYAVGWVLILSEVARSAVLTNNWLTPPELDTGLVWGAIVSAGLFCWWTFRRRVVHHAHLSGGRQERLRNLFLSWAGAVGVVAAGVIPELTTAGGLLTSASLILGALCMSATYPRSSWWS